MTIEERLARLEEAFGVRFIGMDSSQLAAELKPENLVGDRYPYWLSDYQIRVGIAKIEAGIPNLSGPVDKLGGPVDPQ